MSQKETLILSAEVAIAVQFAWLLIWIRYGMVVCEETDATCQKPFWNMDMIQCRFRLTKYLTFLSAQKINKSSAIIITLADKVSTSFCSNTFAYTQVMCSTQNLSFYNKLLCCQLLFQEER